MKFKVRILIIADQQMNRAAAWWAEHRSPRQASQWLSGFYAAIAGLANNPTQNALARESREFPFNVHQLNYGLGRSKTHRALYEIRGDEVIVFAIKHLAQDDLAS